MAVFSVHRFFLSIVLLSHVLHKSQQVIRLQILQHLVESAPLYSCVAVVMSDTVRNLIFDVHEDIPIELSIDYTLVLVSVKNLSGVFSRSVVDPFPPESPSRYASVIDVSILETYSSEMLQHPFPVVAHVYFGEVTDHTETVRPALLIGKTQVRGRLVNGYSTDALDLKEVLSVDYETA